MVSVIDGNGFVMTPTSGVLGLGPNTDYASPFHYPNFFEAANVTSYSIYKRYKDKSSYLQLNEMDTENFDAIHTHNIVDKSWINLNLTSLQIGDKKVEFEGVFATIMSGFEGIAGPSHVMGAFDDEYNVLVAKDCSNLYDMPKVTIGIDGIEYELSAHDYTKKYRGQCSKPFYPFDAPPPLDKHLFIGEPMLRKFPFHYDLKNSTVTFQKEKAQPQDMMNIENSYLM